MGDAMEKSCSSCARSRVLAGRNIACEKCVNYSMHKFPEDVTNKAITFVDKIKEALPKVECHKVGGSYDQPIYSVKITEPTKEKFSLDKLIDDHWYYVEATLSAHDCSEREIEIAGHHYRTAAFHFWKHCVEHYNIKESDDE